MLEVVVSRGGQADLSVLADLRFEWRVSERGEKGLNRASFDDALRDWYVSHRTSHVPFAARVRGERVGLAWLALIDQVGLAWLALIDRVPSPAQFGRRAGMRQSVYVRAAQRERGVGVALVAAMIDYACLLGLEYLTVHPSASSFSIFRRLGFDGAERALKFRDLGG